MLKRTKGEVVFSFFIVYILLAFIAFLSIYPLLYTVSLSFSSTADASRVGFHLFPREISLTSYSMVFNNSDLYTGYANTIFRTILGTAGVILITTMFAYPLSCKYMPHKNIFTFIVLLTMLFDGGMIPSYLLIKKLNLIDNRLVYILPGLVGAYNVIIMKNFFKSIPDSLAESAKIDGANEFTILFKILLPLLKPVIATIALWTAVAHWNAWLDGMLYINTNNKQILQIFLQRIVTQNQSQLIESGMINPDVMSFTSETVKSATIIVTILPILIAYPFVQKYFVKGIILGSIKG